MVTPRLFAGFMFWILCVQLSAGAGHLGPVVSIVHVEGQVYAVSQGGVFLHAGQNTERVFEPGFRVFAMASKGEGREALLLLSGGAPGESGLLASLELQTGKAEVITVSKDVVYDVAVSPNGKEAALACADNRVLTVNLNDFPNGSPVVRHKHTSDARVVEYSPDGSGLVSGGLDGVLLISSTTGDRKVRTLQEHTSGIESLAFSPDGKQFASGARDAKVRVHDLDGGFVRTYRGVGMEAQASGLEGAPRVQALAWGTGRDGLIAGTSKGRFYRLSESNDVWMPTGEACEWPIFSLALKKGKLLIGGDSIIRTRRSGTK